MTFSSNMEGRDIASLINETASALGADPVDLATVISYETGGTFDPMEVGPTTRWGTHRGLIQFGEPQAEQYGADFSSADAALTSQLGANGAIVRYLRQNGYQEGMGILDLYSIINAGAPNMYGASDAASGGAMNQDPSAPPSGASGQQKQIDSSVTDAANEAQRREAYRAAQEFIFSMTPQQRMMEKQLYYKAQLEQGEARGFDQWFTNTRFGNYAQEYMNGDQAFVNQLSGPQQVLLQQLTANVPQAQSFAHYLMGV